MRQKKNEETSKLTAPGKDSLTPVPRLTFAEQKPPKKRIFENYVNFYSDEWPPKDIITIDLVEMLNNHSE